MSDTKRSYLYILIFGLFLLGLGFGYNIAIIKSLYYNTIATVSKYMNRNNILYTVQPEMRSGQLFDLMPLSGGNKLIPRKGSDPALQRKLKEMGAYLPNAEI